MTSPDAGGRVLCRSCGASNDPADQFCGSCGAFLEWTAEPAEVAPPRPSSDVPATDPGAAAGGAAPAPAPATEPADPALVRCPSCGTANVASRTFCQRCGGKLAGAAAVTPRAAGVPPPPVVRVSEPAPAAVPAPHPTARRPTPREADRGGLSSWIVIAIAGLLVGAVLVGGAIALRSNATPPPAAASAAPSASASAPAPSRPRPSPSATSSAATAGLDSSSVRLGTASTAGLASSRMLGRAPTPGTRVEWSRARE
jgi:double zinc ribbon protein